MGFESIRVSAIFGVKPERIYRAWLDSAEHTAITGGAALVEPVVGGRHTAWDGYIEGTVLELEPHRRIVQSWRSSDFPTESGDSRLEVLIEEVPEGTRVTLFHSDIPEGQGAMYEGGWLEHYLEPMGRYFAVPAPLATTETAAARAAAKKASAKKPSAKGASAKKPSAKGASAKKPSAKGTSAKKPATKKAAARTASTRKAATKKKSTRKAATKKKSTRKAATKKRSAAKSPTRQAATRKAATKKSSTRKARAAKPARQKPATRKRR